MYNEDRYKMVCMLKEAGMWDDAKKGVGNYAQNAKKGWEAYQQNPGEVAQGLAAKSREMFGKTLDSANSLVGEDTKKRLADTIGSGFERVSKSEGAINAAKNVGSNVVQGAVNDPTVKPVIDMARKGSDLLQKGQEYLQGADGKWGNAKWGGGGALLGLILWYMMNRKNPNAASALLSLPMMAGAGALLGTQAKKHAAPLASWASFNPKDIA